jgi:hypothetical protein
VPRGLLLLPPTTPPLFSSWRGGRMVQPNRSARFRWCRSMTYIK